MNTLNKLKQLALTAGQTGIAFNAFRKESRLYNTNIKEGQYYEVVMAWMLGYFKFYYNAPNFKVYMTDTADNEGIDFSLRLYGITSYMQMKYNILPEYDRHAYPDYITVVHLYPDIANKKNSMCGNYTMTGDGALLEFLISSDLFTEDALYDFYEEMDNKKTGFIEQIRSVWKNPV